MLCELDAEGREARFYGLSTGLSAIGGPLRPKQVVRILWQNIVMEDDLNIESDLR
jgi:hypothetical protein